MEHANSVTSPTQEQQNQIVQGLGSSSSSAGEFHSGLSGELNSMSNVQSPEQQPELQTAFSMGSVGMNVAPMNSGFIPLGNGAYLKPVGPCTVVGNINQGQQQQQQQLQPQQFRQSQLGSVYQLQPTTSSCSASSCYNPVRSNPASPEGSGHSSQNIQSQMSQTSQYGQQLQSFQVPAIPSPEVTSTPQVPQVEAVVRSSIGNVPVLKEDEELRFPTVEEYAEFLEKMRQMKISGPGAGRASGNASGNAPKKLSMGNVIIPSPKSSLSSVSEGRPSAASASGSGYLGSHASHSIIEEAQEEEKSCVNDTVTPKSRFPAPPAAVTGNFGKLPDMGTPQRDLGWMQSGHGGHHEAVVRTSTYAGCSAGHGGHHEHYEHEIVQMSPLQMSPLQHHDQHHDQPRLQRAPTPPPPGGHHPNSKRTTVMLRNIPNKYTQKMLLEELDAEDFAGLYDFFYLPIDFKNKCNVGYCFINLVNEHAAEAFKVKFQGYKLRAYNSPKICDVSYARVQGCMENVEIYRNSPINGIGVEEYRPIIFHNGVRVAFPLPDEPVPGIHVRGLKQSHFQ